MPQIDFTLLQKRKQIIMPLKHKSKKGTFAQAAGGIIAEMDVKCSSNRRSTQVKRTIGLCPQGEKHRLRRSPLPYRCGRETPVSPSPMPCHYTRASPTGQQHTKGTWQGQTISPPQQPAISENTAPPPSPANSQTVHNPHLTQNDASREGHDARASPSPGQET